jgi:macrolide-specific efflux system membrane fusion protein
MSVEPAKVAESPMSRHVIRHKWLWLSAAAPVILIAGWWLWSMHGHVAESSAPAMPTKAKLIQAQSADIEQTVSAAGKLQLYKYADVNARVSGQVDDILVAIGDDVRAGKLLLRITPNLSATRTDSDQAQLARLRAELAEQKAQLDFAELQFKRQSQLKAENATREETFEASRAAMVSATARVDAINARIRQTEASIREEKEMRKHTEVTAPISGTIVSLSVRPGQVVNAGQQTTALMRIADLSKLTVQARVAEIDVPHLEKGMAAYFTTPGYPGKRWFGKVRQIIPVPAEGSGEQGKETFYNVLFEVANPDRQLMSGMSAQVRFVTAHARNAIVLPADMPGQPDADGLYTLTVIGADGKARPRKVRIGIRNERMVQIVSGLSPGEKVLPVMQNSSAVPADAGKASLSP